MDNNYRALLVTNRWFVWLDNNLIIKVNFIEKSEDIFKILTWAKTDFGKESCVKETERLIMSSGSKAYRNYFEFIKWLDTLEKLTTKKIQWADLSFLTLLDSRKDKEINPIENLYYSLSSRLPHYTQRLELIFGEVKENKITNLLKKPDWNLPWHKLPYYTIGNIFKCNLCNKWQADRDFYGSSSQLLICRECYENTECKECRICGTAVFTDIDFNILYKKKDEIFHSKECFLKKYPEIEIEEPDCEITRVKL